MCQLNVYMIDKFVPGVDVKEVFNRHHHKKFANINEEIEIKEYDDKYNYYEASANRCDCGSVVGLIKDYKGKFKTYKDYLQSMNKHELINLYKIKELLLSPDYQSRLNGVLITRDEMFSKLEGFTKSLKEKEATLSELSLKESLNIMDQIEMKKLRQQISEIKQALSDNHEYKMLEKAYNEFIKQNELLIMSRNYTLNHKKDWWQENIDLKISKTEHEYHIHTNAEFNHLKYILDDVLKLTDEVKVFSISQDDDVNYDNLKEVSSVPLSSMALEDLIFLKDKEVITITR